MRSKGIVALVAVFAIAAPAAAQGQVAGEDAAVAPGRMLFEEKCTACHTVGEGDFNGPDLARVTERRSREWLLRFIVEPERVLAEGDPIALELFKKYDELPMPNPEVTSEQAEAILAYTVARSAATGAAAGSGVPVAAAPGSPGLRGKTATQVYVGILFLIIVGFLGAVFVFVYRGSQPRAELEKFESVFDKAQRYWMATLLVAAPVFTVALLPLVPFPLLRAATEGRQTVEVEARQFGWAIKPRSVTAGTPVEFRVTGRDVNHSFALVDPYGVLVFQVQAMPGYVKEGVYTFEQAGTYHVLCLEYCGLAHHAMRATIQVVQ